MRYYVTVNKKYKYVRVYDITKRTNESTNRISKYVTSLINKFLLKQGNEQ